MSIDMGGYDARKTVLSSKEEQEKVFAKHKEKVGEAIDRAVEEAFKEFDGLYMGWFTPDELDLVLEALLQYGQNDPNKAKQVFDLLKAMTELKEEGVKNDPA